MAPIVDLRAWFEGVVEENYRLFFSTAFRILRNEHDAEEATQHAILKTWRNLDSLEDTNKVVGWLNRAVRNAAIDRHRKRKTKSEVAGPEDMEDDDLDAEAGIKKLEQEEALGKIWSAVEELPENQAMVLTMRYQQELDHSQIAERTGLKPGHVAVLLHRAHQGLKKMLAS